MLRTSLAVLLLAASPASADVDRCATGDTDLAYTGTDLPEISGDTGWFPSGYVAQLRLSESIKIQLGKEVGGTDPGEPEGVEESGCSAGGSSGFGVAFLFGLMFLVRRRRR